MLKFFILAAYFSATILGQGVHTDLTRGVHTSIVSSDPPSFTNEPARNANAGGVHTDLLNPPKIHTRILGKRAVNIRETSFNSSTRLMPTLQRRALGRPPKRRKHLNISIRIRLPSLPRRRPKPKRTHVRVLVKRQIPAGVYRRFGLASEPRHLVRRQIPVGALRHFGLNGEHPHLVRRQIPAGDSRHFWFNSEPRHLVRRQRPIAGLRFGLTAEHPHLVKREIDSLARSRPRFTPRPSLPSQRRRDRNERNLVRRQIPSVSRRPWYLRKLQLDEEGPKLARRQRPIGGGWHSGLTAEHPHLVRRQIPTSYYLRFGLASEHGDLVRREVDSLARSRPRFSPPVSRRKERKERHLVRRQIPSLARRPPFLNRRPRKEKEPKLVRRQRPIGGGWHSGLTSEPRHLVRRDVNSVVRHHRLPPRRKERKERELVRRQLVNLNHRPRRRMPTKRADRLQ